MSISRDNHYVPIWHQRGFLSSNRGKIFLRDLKPERVELPKGGFFLKDKSGEWSPKQCFVEEDLYTVKIYQNPTDVIEKHLFGNIDNKGSVAVKALITNDLRTLHFHYREIFEYLDAQKLRTPKGLSWVESHFSGMDQNQLMAAMMNLRRIHCLMWTEAVMEMVTAKESPVKFLFSDHPVAIFNLACPPGHPMNSHPKEPDIAFKGSQTVFPLDRENCLILTNLEYAKNSDLSDLLTPRTNARTEGESIIYTAKDYRGRELKAEQVMAINHFIKIQAQRYVAGGSERDLEPETYSWKEIAKVLRTSEKLLFHYGGEMYMGFKDGTVRYQDAFGRGYYYKTDPPDFNELKKS